VRVQHLYLHNASIVHQTLNIAKEICWFARLSVRPHLSRDVHPARMRCIAQSKEAFQHKRQQQLQQQQHMHGFVVYSMNTQRKADIEGSWEASVNY
jgi:hypothetical protein